MPNKTRQPISAQVKIIIAIVLICAVLIVQFLIWPMAGLGQDRDMYMYNTGRSVVYDFDARASFHSNDSNFFFATRGGMRSVTSGGETRWNTMFNINRPVMVARGDIVAVGEAFGGHHVYVFNSDGLMFRAVFDNPVSSFFVNESGFVAAIVQYESGYGIHVYNQHRTSGMPLFQQGFVDDLIMPIGVEISQDGRYIAISTVNLNLITTTSLQIRYMNDWDAAGTDNGLFSWNEFSDQFITAMRFMEGDRLVVATTSQIICYSIQGNTRPSTVRELWSINLQNQLSHLQFYGNRYLAYITGDRFVDEPNADSVGTLRIVNIIDGRQTGMFELNRRATHLRMGQNSVIVGADRSYHAISFSGVHLWEHIIPHDVIDVLFLDNTDTILVAGVNRADIFQRRRQQRATPEDSAF